MADETIILAVDIETREAQSQLDLLNKAIEDGKKKQESLNQQFKEGQITLEEYNKASRENTKEIKANETATKNLTTAVQAESKSISALSAENRELVKQRNLISTATEDGRNKIRELNRQIDLNNIAIKENVSGLEKQRLNIGNYASALQGVGGSLKGIVPGLGGMTNGIMGITAGAKAFTATPFGATLQVIAGLLTVLIEAFKGSEEGQRNLNKVTQVTTALFGALGDIVRQIGGFLIDAFKNPKQAMMDLVDFLRDNLVNRFKAFGVIIEGIKNLDFKQVTNGALQLGSGIENVIGKVQNVGKRIIEISNQALEQGNKVAELQAQIEDLEDEANLRRAQNDIKVAKLREDAIKQEGDAKRKSIEQAIALEKQSADFSINIAQKKVQLAQAELAIATNKKEATDNLEEAEVNLARAQAERYQATLRFEKQLEALNDQARKKAELDAQFTQEAIEARQDAELAALSNQLDAENQAKEEAAYKNAVTQLEIDSQLKKDLEAQQKTFDFQRDQDAQRESQKQIAYEQSIANARRQALFETLGIIQSISKEGSAISKAAALAEVAYSTGEAIANLTSKTVDGTPLGVLRYALGLARILANISKAKQIINSGNVTSVSSETSRNLPASVTARGVTEARGTTNQIDQQFLISNAFRNMPPIVASWKEATEVGNKVRFKEALTTA